MDTKPMLMLQWSTWPPPWPYRSWPAGTTFWQLVRMKLKPLHQMWVRWLPPENLARGGFGDDMLPFDVDLYRDSTTDGADGTPALFDAGLHILNGWKLAVSLARLRIDFGERDVTCIGTLCASHATGPTRRQITGFERDVPPAPNLLISNKIFV